MHPGCDEIEIIGYESVIINTGPHVTIPTAVWSNFENGALVSGTVFSSVANIDAVYPPVAFTSDVDLTDTSKVADFFDTNFVSISNESVQRYAVSTINDQTLTHAYTGNLDYATTVPLEASGNYQVVMAAKDASGNIGIGRIESSVGVSNYRTFENAGTNGTLTLLDDNKHMKVTHTAEFYATTGVSFDISDSSVGKQYDFEMYFDPNTTYVYGGLTFGAEDTAQNDRRTTQAGYYIDFYETFNGTNHRIRYAGTGDVEFHNNTPNEILGVTETMFGGEWARYFTMTIVSDSKQFTRNDLKIQAYLDAERTKLVWTIPNMSKLDYHCSNPPSDTIYINLWGQLNQTMHFANFGERVPQPTFTPLSTLRTVINSAEFTESNDLTLSGEVTASETEGATTSYTALATTNPNLSADEVRTLMGNVGSEALVTGEAGTEWVLVNRDIVGQFMPSTIQNVGTEADATDSTKPYSRLGDLMNGEGDMTDVEVKADGRYVFRMIPYGPVTGNGAHATNHSEWNEHFENPDNARWYIEWAQELNPTNVDYTGSEINGMNLQTIDGTTGYTQVGFGPNSGRVRSDGLQAMTDGRVFAGLYKTSYSSTWLAGDLSYGGNHWAIGHTGYHSGYSNMINFHGFGNWTESKGTDQLASDPNSTYLAVGRSVELWILKKKPIPTVIPKVVDVTGAVYDTSAVNYANVYLYGSDGVNAKHDALATKTIDPNQGAPWNASAKYWRVKVLSIYDSTTPSKVMGGSSGSTSITMGNLYELALVEADGSYGTFITPIDVSLTNSSGVSRANVSKIQNDSYATSEQGGVYIDVTLDEFINITYTFDSAKTITQINIGNGGLNGLPIDMEIYNSDDQTNWNMHSRLSYQTNDMPDSAGNFTTIQVSQNKTMLVYDSSNSRWYYNGYTNQSGTNHATANATDIPHTADYPYTGFTSSYVPKAADPAPYVQVTDVSEVSYGSLTVTGTVFSSVANITGTKAAVFAPSFNLNDANEAALATFVTENGTDLSLTADRYAVGAFTSALGTGVNVHTDLAGSTSGALVDGSSYQVVVVATDASSNIGIGTFGVTFSKLWRFNFESYYYQTQSTQAYTSFYPSSDIGYYQTGQPSGFFNAAGEDIFKSAQAHVSLNGTNSDGTRTSADITTNSYGWFTTANNPFTAVSGDFAVHSGPYLSADGSQAYELLANQGNNYWGYNPEYVLMVFKDGILGSEFKKIAIDFSRVRSLYSLQYYKGDVSDLSSTYDENNWETYATLKVDDADFGINGVRPNWVIWDNIEEGSTVTAQTNIN